MRQNLAVTTILLSLILSFVFGYNFFVGGYPVTPIGETGRDIVIHMPFHSWSFEPEKVVIEKGETFRFLVVNDDEKEHGFAIDPYGIHLMIPANATATSEEVYADEPGNFIYYCFSSCGEGIVSSGKYKGEQRGRFDMEGEFIVRTPP